MNIRNVAIIAHVDHGKTTLVDALLRQTQTKLGKELVGTDLIMDSNELEKERGITIFSKNASVNYKGTKINIVDTPGHADFGGEVERVLKMVDGCLLLIDAKEGPMPQTRFVLKTALKMGHKIIVVINKIDKADARIDYGQVKANQDIIRINRDGEKNKYRLTSLMTFEGLERVDAIEALAGDIVALSGISAITIGETITDSMDTEPLPLLSIEEPTVRMTFSVNTSPFAGKEGEFKTSRQIRERLYKALETDVALRVDDNDSGGWVASGRGELHLAILIERLRREGYEFQVSRPQVIEKTINGKVMTPFERVFIEVPETYSGIVMQKMGFRHGKLQDMNNENGVVYLEFIIATKELFGYRSEFITDT